MTYMGWFYSRFCLCFCLAGRIAIPLGTHATPIHNTFNIQPNSPPAAHVITLQEHTQSPRAQCDWWKQFKQKALEIMECINSIETSWIKSNSTISCGFVLPLIVHGAVWCWRTAVSVGGLELEHSMKTNNIFWTKNSKSHNKQQTA